jgi:hypothetical protein
MVGKVGKDGDGGIKDGRERDESWLKRAEAFREQN